MIHLYTNIVVVPAQIENRVPNRLLFSFILASILTNTQKVLIQLRCHCLSSLIGYYTNISSPTKWLVVSDLYDFATKTWFWDDHRFFNVDPLSSYIISGILVRQWAQSGRGGRSAFNLENPEYLEPHLWMVILSIIIKQSRTRPYTRQHQSRTGGQGHWWKLDHFSAWFRTPWGTNRPTDLLTDRVTYRVACTRLKTLDSRVSK